MEQFILDLLSSVGKINFKSVWDIFIYAFVAFWIVVLYWIWLDSGDRTSNTTARVCYVLLGLFLNVVGLVIYLIIRPNQTIEEIYWSDLERRYLKYETSELGDCPKCGTQLFPGFRYCPECKYKLKVKCPSCNLFVDRKYKYCPHCSEEIGKSDKYEQLETPSKEIMQEQIVASRTEATEVVETSRTRYSVKKGIAVEVGERVIGVYKIVAEKLNELFKNGKSLVTAKKEQAKKVSSGEKKSTKKNKKKR
ncbi:hypothetical protein GYA44_02335 [Candidatus Microgenomates bacterium]|nr:hypothetical protein [Candidatus Microgenomates bacterium]